MSKNLTKRIFVLGGGFGGLYAAIELEKTLARATDVEESKQSEAFKSATTPHRVAHRTWQQVACHPPDARGSGITR